MDAATGEIKRLEEGKNYLQAIACYISTYDPVENIGTFNLARLLGIDTTSYKIKPDYLVQEYDGSQYDQYCYAGFFQEYSTDYVATYMQTQTNVLAQASI